MIKYRKLFCIIALSAAISMLFAACGKATKNTETESDVADNSQSAEEVVLETVEEQVLVDEFGLKVTLNSLTYSETYGKGAILTFENNSLKTLTFNCKKMMINGIMTPDLFGERLQSGESTTVTGYFGSAMFDYIGIDNVGEITFVFDFFDQDYESVYTSEDIVVQTSAYDSMDTEIEFDGEKVYEGYGMTIYGHIAHDDVFENAMVLYIDNDADVDYLFRADGMSINGEYHEDMYSTDVRKHSGRLAYVEFSEDMLNELGVESLEEIQIQYHVYDRDNAEVLGTTDIMTITK